MPLQINKGTNPFYPTYYFDMALRQVSLTDTSQRSISYPTIFIWPYNLASENNQIHLGFTRSIPLGGRLYYFFFKKGMLTMNSNVCVFHFVINLLLNLINLIIYKTRNMNQNHIIYFYEITTKR